MDKRRRKLRDAVAEDTVGGRDYERRLRRQYEKINPTPEWATKARKRVQDTTGKRRRSSTDSEPDAEEAEDSSALDSLLSGTGSVLAGRRAKILAHGSLSIERLRDANLSAKADGEIKVVQFHPSPQVPVLFTTSADRRLRLFTVRFTDFPTPLFSSPLYRWTDIPTRTSRPSISPPSPSRTPCSTLAAPLSS